MKAILVLMIGAAVGFVLADMTRRREPKLTWTDGSTTWYVPSDVRPVEL